MRVRVKICGVTSAGALQAAVDAGADAVGFVMTQSPRQIGVDEAAILIDSLPPWVASVVVTRQPPADFGDRVLARLAPDWWQSDRADLAGQAVPHGTRFLPVVREGEPVEGLPSCFVYEGAHSGQGCKVDWRVAAALAIDRRMVLAGGLNPDNVADAIRAVRPWAVDVSSGVERTRGIKDPDAIARFVDAVRDADDVTGATA